MIICDNFNVNILEFKENYVNILQLGAKNFNVNILEFKDFIRTINSTTITIF